MTYLQHYLKACLLKLGVDFPRTHSVRRLLELIHEITSKDEVKKLLSKFLCGVRIFRGRIHYVKILG